ncbi:hypothetical protein [Halorubrum sp. ARQ200]|uniref:hypothetical protein n=1 Tax=Halorubrum sp. ARQ200 TaxID=1855872 RepID=UPI0010F6CEF0|nr:hypothetical protein [Halorubrum sp. ARQ200]TKX45812.1 hypothetical protein EXE50_01030 [Halorubrum sp. ARQ200]
MNEIDPVVVGSIVYLLGALTITIPGIAYLEPLHRPGRLLRGLEELEAGELKNSDTGFDDTLEELNTLVSKENKLDGNITKLKVLAGTAEVGGRGMIHTVRAYEGDEEISGIEEQTFDKLRYQIDRSIRNGKTKIRTVGVILILIGLPIQLL